jgi:hypothetical protein
MYTLMIYRVVGRRLPNSKVLTPCGSPETSQPQRQAT